MKQFITRYRLSVSMLVIICLFMALGWSNRGNLLAQDETPDIQESPTITAVMKAFEADQQAPLTLDSLAFTPCVGGSAGGYPCNNVDLMAFMPLSTIGGGSGNDIWGWTDPLTNNEYALMGRTSGTAFVDITNPESPVYLGNLPTHTFNSSWRDIKVYANHAFIVSEASGHGMQVFDLTQLRSVGSPPVTFSNTAHYSGFGNAHNIVINEDSGYAYAVGTSTCSGGLHMVNIQNPTSPSNAGCYSGDGYTHDAQCVIYNGPDTTYQGDEICFNSNEDTLTIVNTTNKSSPVQLSRTGYGGSRYTHQGWLTDDHTYFLLDDELDEQGNGHNTRTYIWNVSNLDAPSLIGNFTASTAAIDHNLYIKGDYAYQSNYRAGLRVLDIENIASASLTEVAYFDIYPSSNSPSFNGAWSNYPYFDSGIVIVSGIEQGLFILRPNVAPPSTPTPGPSPTPTNTPAPPTATNTPPPVVCTTYNSTDVPKSLPVGTASVSSVLNVSGSDAIVDMNFNVNMPHAWVGDLSMALVHQGTGTSVTVLDRPGVPSSTYGCSGDNIVATLDDEAGSPVENQCAGGTPTINGTFTPNNPLSSFDGESGNGTWVLTVTDHYVSADAGSLNSWSLEICTADTGPKPTDTPAPPTSTSAPPTATNTPAPPTATPSTGVVFFDNFESAQGWTVNPNGTDTATTGQWERANPEQTTYSGSTFQLGTTVSGNNDLVTGAAAGSSVGANDLDGGVTSIRSPNIALPSSGNITLSFAYYLSHYSNSSSADFLRVTVVGSSSSVVFEELGAANVDAAVWANHSANLNAFAGQTIYLLIEAADASGGSLVEAAVDDVGIEVTTFGN